MEVFRFWAAEQKKRVNRIRKPLGVASVAYLEYMERVGRNRSYIGHVRRALLDLEEEVGDLPVGEITTEQIRDYLFGLPYGAVTIRNKRNYYLGAFGWWQKQGWAEYNSMSRVESPPVQDKEPEILTVPEMRQLFKANEKVDPGSRSAATTAPIPKGVGKSVDCSPLGLLPACAPRPLPGLTTRRSTSNRAVF